MPTEPIPVNEFITELENQWTFSNVSGTSKKPGFIEVTGAAEPMRYNLNVNDQIIARASGPALQEIPIGNIAMETLRLPSILRGGKIRKRKRTRRKQKNKKNRRKQKRKTIKRRINK